MTPEPERRSLASRPLAGTGGPGQETGRALPGGYRPQYAMIYAVASNGALGIVTVNPDGTVVCNSGSNVYFSLSGITFRQFA